MRTGGPMQREWWFMKAARHVLLAMAALGLGGCVALNRSSLAPKARPVAERTLDVDAFVAEHNRNAELIQSMTANPTIRVQSSLTKAVADGKLAVVRPRNFKLEVSAGMNQSMANIGSNDEEFWFWVKNEKDPSIYWCDYSDLESSALAVTYQPDWIIQALGLNPITPQEAAGIEVRTTNDPNATALLFPPTKNGGETIRRMMIVSKYTRRIKEHRLYSGNVQTPQTLLAQADVPSYKDIDVEKSESGAFQTCYLPESLRLEWKKDQLILNVLLKDVVVNSFDSSRAAAIFKEPVIPGYERVNLAEMARTGPRDNRTTVRRTLPMPGSRNGVRMGRPAPATDDTAEAPRARASSASRSSGRTTSPLEELVRAPLPVGPESEATRQAAATWAGTDTSPLGR